MNWGALNAERVEKHLVPDDQKRQFDVSGKEPDEEGYLCGASGCGLCALWHLSGCRNHPSEAGGEEGNHSDFMERDIRNLRQALGRSWKGQIRRRHISAR